jgi:2-polyprenyl-6-hydroxyphenyl methylase/3-demethylubiquinone-9 3-methyltransferase
MSVGAVVRGLFGRWEKPVAEAYRSLFVDLDAFVACLRAIRPTARRILDVGCGEGALSERLAAAYPDATITAIDLTPRLGRLFGGDRDRVVFRRVPVGEVASSEPGSFDLVTMCDVLHHVPPSGRAPLLADIGRTLAPDGLFAMKDWARAATPIHFACWASDRILTGDAVDYLVPEEAGAILASVFGAARVSVGETVPPWSNNMVFYVRR